MHICPVCQNEMQYQSGLFVCDTKNPGSPHFVWSSYFDGKITNMALNFEEYIVSYRYQEDIISSIYIYRQPQVTAIWYDLRPNPVNERYFISEEEIKNFLVMTL